MPIQTVETLFSDKEISKIKSLLKKGNEKELREYLNEEDRKKWLISKQIYPDYLYYFFIENKTAFIKATHKSRKQ